MRCRPSLCSLLALFILGLTLLYGFSSGKEFYSAHHNLNIKRGYLLDREGEPLVINKERFRAYLILKGDSLFGKNWPKELQPYLERPLDLPRKGLFLLSENLSLEEVKELKRIENVIIKGELERKILFDGLKPLIGEVSEGDGISGLEKVFDNLLKRGDSVFTALDSKILRKVYYLKKDYGDFSLKGVALFKISTGEMLAYYSSGEGEWLGKEVYLSEEGLFSEIKEVRWELGSFEKKPKEITPLHLVKHFLTEACGKPLDPTLLPKKEEICTPAEGEKEALYFLKEPKKWLYLARKDNLLYTLLGEIPENKEIETLDKLKNHLNYLVKRL